MNPPTDDDGYYIPPNRYWVIRSPGDQGVVVAKFDGEFRIPVDVAEYDGFTIQSVPDRSALVNATVDQSGLSESELDLLSAVYPIR